MARFSGILAGFVAVAVTTSAALCAGMMPQQSLHGLVGHWTCVTHDSMHKTWHETDVYSMAGAWLRDDSTFPAQNGEHAGNGVSLSRWDSQTHRWVIMYTDTTGMYFAASSASSSFNGSHWVDNLPADNGTATVRMPSMNSMVIDSSGPDGHGHTVANHQVCTRT